jgi:3-hydroxy-5-methyl-1-naphthoate 3-O-methyltransferase
MLKMLVFSLSLRAVKLKESLSSFSLSPDPIFQTLIGFWASKALMAAVELELFTKLSGGKQMTLNKLQKILGMEARPTGVFGSALASLGLLQVTKTEEDGEDLFANSPVSEMFLDKSKDSYMGDIITMFDKRLYKAWDKLVESLQTNKPVNAIDGGGAESIFDQAKSKQAVEEIQKFTHAMYGVSISPAIQLPKVYDFSKHSRMMDIGGGSGIYAIQVVKANPHMIATVLDLEAVCQVAEQYIRSYNLEDKVKTKHLDFFKEDIPKGYDVVFLSLILHDYSEEKGIALLKKIYKCLANDGVVLISEWLLNDEKTGPAASALMGLNMIIETYGGKNYSYTEIVDMLKQAGFKRPERRSLAGPAEIVIGYKV